ncbi:hypothetical protein RMATCC62417_18297 [Rhizopus microsporus]|nr:hypothetical protein RMATCC62417_18297 [Rhizopus microsporus]
MIDPTFNMDKFMVDARTYIVPELMEAYLKGDVDTLKLWCSEATYNVLTAVIQAQVQQGLISDCKIQDLRDIELVAAKILENDVPVLVLSFRTQEIIVFRNARTDKVRQDIQALQWAIVDRVDAVTILQETEAQVMDMLKQKLAEFIETMEVPIGNISPAMIKHDQVRVVVVGGGFTGFTVASILDQMPRFYVTLIDTKDSFEYTPGIVKKIVNPDQSSSLRVRHDAYVKNGRVIIGYAEELCDDGKSVKVNNEFVIIKNTYVCSHVFN